MTVDRRRPTVRDLPGTPETASLRDAAAAALGVALPTLAKGVVQRRPAMVALAERLGSDAAAVRRMQRLRARHGPGPVVVPLPFRPQAILLDARQVGAVLAGAPEPFAPATLEKRSVLAHFEPDVSLASRPPERGPRRRANEAVLESGCPVHGAAGRFVAVIGEEIARLVARAAPGRRLAWDDFTASWQAIVRRVVLGDAARMDEALTDGLGRLRGRANWGFLAPRDRSLRARIHAEIDAYAARAEPDSLAGRMRGQTALAPQAHSDQLAHHLFAFDAAGIATFRTILLLAAHDREREAARDEALGAPPGRRPHLRACLLEALRLWPTTPAIFRETTEDVPWGGGVLRRGTHVLVFTPFFHRDDEILPFAHAFAPEIWGHEAAARRFALVPFSDGPGACPARDLVPLLAAETLAAILARVDIAPMDARLSPKRPLPGTLDPYGSAVIATPGP